MIILGIDPGSRITGYGIIRQEKKNLYYIDSGCIRTSPTDLSQRLMDIFNGICSLMETHVPDEVAIEEIFMHKNASSALKLGHARGVAMVAAASHRVKIHEYAARAVKQALVGNGGAHKQQVQHMVVQLLRLNRAPQSDAADALAIAICHCHTRQNLMYLQL